MVQYSRHFGRTVCIIPYNMYNIMYNLHTYIIYYYIYVHCTFWLDTQPESNQPNIMCVLVDRSMVIWYTSIFHDNATLISTLN